MSGVSLRKFPYPYRAALAISNDADLMTEESFRVFHRYLGAELGLPVADSFFLFSSPQSPNKLTLFEGVSSKPSRLAGFLTECARAGLIDTLHTYGCFTTPEDFSRERAARGIEALDRLGIKLKVWVNHGSQANVQCFGLAGVGHYHGDKPGTRFYHTDLTLSYGIKYCWLGNELADCVGQDSDRALSYWLDQARVGMKHLRRRRFSALKPQTGRLMRPVVLRDGNSVLSFQRYSGTLGLTPVFDDIVDQLSEKNLERLKALGGYTILYQHFAVRRKASGFGVDSYKPNSAPYLTSDERAAFERLAGQYHGGEIFVATTSRLLDYYSASRGLRWQQERAGERIKITLLAVAEPCGALRPIDRKQVEGLTFYTDRPALTDIFVRGESGEQQVRDLIRNPADATGRKSVSIPVSTVECHAI